MPETVDAGLESRGILFSKSPRGRGPGVGGGGGGVVQYGRHYSATEIGSFC